MDIWKWYSVMEYIKEGVSFCACFDEGSLWILQIIINIITFNTCWVKWKRTSSEEMASFASWIKHIRFLNVCHFRMRGSLWKNFKNIVQTIQLLKKNVYMMTFWMRFVVYFVSIQETLLWSSVMFKSLWPEVCHASIWLKRIVLVVGILFIGRYLMWRHI